MEDAIKEMQKPLARYIDDEDLDRMLREQEREGDPMASFIKKSKAKESKDKKGEPLRVGGAGTSGKSRPAGRGRAAVCPCGLRPLVFSSSGPAPPRVLHPVLPLPSGSGATRVGH